MEERVSGQRVTHSRKRYVFVCAACGCLDEGRRDQITCSTRCRVKLHRHPELLAATRQAAEAFDVTVAATLQARAVHLLRPDLASQIEAGKATFDSINAEMLKALNRLALAQAQRLTA
jgi:hypothetical protein